MTIGQSAEAVADSTSLPISILFPTEYQNHVHICKCERRTNYTHINASDVCMLAPNLTEPSQMETNMLCELHKKRIKVYAWVNVAGDRVHAWQHTKSQSIGRSIQRPQAYAITAHSPDIEIGSTRCPWPDVSFRLSQSFLHPLKSGNNRNSPREIRPICPRPSCF